MTNATVTPTLRLLLIAAACLSAGCVDATIEQYRQGSSNMAEGERVVVLGRRHNNAYETESDFVDCIGNALDSGSSGVSVVRERQFVDDLFPWFEPRTAPLKTDDLPDLLANPLIAARLEREGLRYLVWLDGSTNTTDSAGSMTCTLSPGGGGCFGFVTWNRDSSYEASIWDLRTFQNVGRISSDASGTSYMPAVVIPVPIIARVQSEACSGLANQLREFFGSGGGTGP
ncbi:MAG TPA: hypothetical protein VLA56_16070 [Pseudomonadales bacterium]|nr:hypothetical protein [Pseudomonadales bacterium]